MTISQITFFTEAHLEFIGILQPVPAYPPLRAHHLRRVVHHRHEQVCRRFALARADLAGVHLKVQSEA